MSRFESLYQPWAVEKAKTLSDKDDPALRCVPVAFGTLNVSLYGLGFVGQIVQTPGFVVMLTETYHSFKLIPTDGRKHRDDVAPSFRGDSVGHWDGDTLVVDTTNFTDSNWMHAEGTSPSTPTPCTSSNAIGAWTGTRSKSRRWWKIPKCLTGPWNVPTQTLRLAPFDQIMEVGCTGVESAGLMDAASKVNYGKK